MFSISTNPLIISAIAFAISVLSTYTVREMAHKFGFVAKPKADRWHKRPTAMMGGVAIFASVAIVYFLFIPLTNQSLIVFGASAFLFLIGLVDDIYQIKPYQKLIGQLIGASIVVGYGLNLHWTNIELVNYLLTIFWLIGITNAINLLDNMDGLAAGITAIATFALCMGLGGDSPEILLISAFIASLLGFLVFNFNPASIFMGDCGSMFIGFFLASAVLLNQGEGGRSRSIFSVLAVPVLILFVPIFDTTFVTLLRKLWGRSASQGGRDHTSHRLVALGLSERNAVILLYALAALGGSLALLVRQLRASQSFALVVAFTVGLTILGVYLAKVKVYEEQDEEIAAQNNAVFGFLVDLTYKRRIFEVLLDIVLISLAYLSAYILVVGTIDGDNLNLFLKTLPILLVIKIASFLLAGVYRGLWRYTSIADIVVYGKGVAIGSVLSVLAVLLLYRFGGFSRAVFFIDGLVLLILLTGSRMAFRVFREIIPSPMNTNGRRVLIYGADDGGELVLREINNNPEWNYAAVGFIDDNPHKKDTVIHGLRVFGGNGMLPKICQEYNIDEILLSSRKISPERIGEIKEMCTFADIGLKRASLRIEALDDIFD